MCGRIALINADKKKVKKRFNLKKVPDELRSHYNIPPSQKIPVILNSAPTELTMARWGLIPHWAKDEQNKYSMINARAETIAEKPAYRGPIRKHRCLILADTFYEWKKDKHHKRPYRFMMKSEEVFAFAGIWDVWKEDDREVMTCAIITTKSNRFMRPIHDRMPVVLNKDFERKWLENIALDKVLEIVNDPPNIPMRAYEISTLVNSPQNDSAEILYPI